MTLEYPVSLEASEEVVPEAIDPRHTVGTPVDRLGAARVVGHRKRVMTVEVTEPFDRRDDPVTRRSGVRGPVVADLEPLGLKAQRPGQVLRIFAGRTAEGRRAFTLERPDGLGRCLLYTSDAADE